VTELYTRVIPEFPIANRRLGRHVHRDSRSLAYKVIADGTAVSASWARKTPVLDQGDLASCTGNAACGVLGTEPFYTTLAADMQVGLKLDEDEAVSLYSRATQLDSYVGTYKPDDTGSDGLSVAKAAQKAGLISGYQHITSVAAAQTAIQSGPFIVGTDWFDGMDNPDPNGLVKATGNVRGGHEYECDEYDAINDLWWFWNSWGPGFGVRGRFCYSSGTFAQLLSRDGDATVFVPITSPAPTPTPTPTPGGVVKTFTPADAAALDSWAAAPHWWSKATRAAKAWKSAT
jgi:hypothetical protein